MNWGDLLRTKVHKESDIHPHAPIEQAHLFSSLEGGSVELEVMDFLYGVVRLFKPVHILETGTHLGVSAAALGVACKQNGFGKVVSVELEEEKVVSSRKLISGLGLDAHVEIIQGNSLDVIAQLDADKIKFDFVFLDSITPDRPREFELLYARGLMTKLVAFHDTSRSREQSLKNPEEPQQPYIDAMDQIEKRYCRGGIETNFSRGFRLMQLRESH